ncbi:MAG: hypothetical protein FWC32_00420 [Firmicutes bacterium]|nr:hypothetical protein [Bacillota bacterium]
MRKVISEIVEAFIVGLCMSGILLALRVEADIWQFMAVAGGAILSVGIGGFVRKAIATGEYFYNYEWSYQYGEHAITVKAGKTEELYINGELVDKKSGVSFKSVELKAQLSTGENIKVILSGEKIRKAVSNDKFMRCELFVDDVLLQTGMA